MHFQATRDENVSNMFQQLFAYTRIYAYRYIDLMNMLEYYAYIESFYNKICFLFEFDRQLNAFDGYGGKD